MGIHLRRHRQEGRLLTMRLKPIAAILAAAFAVPAAADDMATVMAEMKRLALAASTGWLVTRGARFLSYRVLFGASEIVLLLIAGSLLGAGIDRMIGYDWLPPLLDPVWDSSALLDDGSGAGRVLADFAGYRARPSASLLIAYAVFWAYTLWRLDRGAPTTSR